MTSTSDVTSCQPPAEAYRATIGLFYSALMRIFNRKWWTSTRNRKRCKSSKRKKRKRKEKKSSQAGLLCDTFRAVLFVRVTADPMHRRGEKSRPWSRPQLHGYSAKLTVCHAVAIFVDYERPTETHRRHQPENGRELLAPRTLSRPACRRRCWSEEAAQRHREDIRELQENADNVLHRLERLEQELDSLKVISKQWR